MPRYIAASLLVDAAETAKGDIEEAAAYDGDKITATTAVGDKIIYPLEVFDRLFLPAKPPEQMSIIEIKAELVLHNREVQNAVGRVRRRRERLLRALHRQGRRTVLVDDVQPWMGGNGDMRGYHVRVRTDDPMDLRDAQRLWDTTFGTQSPWEEEP